MYQHQQQKGEVVRGGRERKGDFDTCHQVGRNTCYPAPFKIVSSKGPFQRGRDRERLGISEVGKITSSLIYCRAITGCIL